MHRRILGKPAGWALVALLALWVPLLWRWARVWLDLPDQGYGWGVPVLAAYLLAECWRRAAAPDRPRPALGACVMGVGLALWAADLPVLEANALWPTAQWWGAAGAVVAMLGALIQAGGVRWAAQFAFPPLFMLTALTWPTPVKTWIVENLAATNARLAAEMVSAAGHPAVVSGNVIVVGTGLVGIAEACSGLRSLQAVWMLAWFAGAYFWLNWPRRLFLVAAALAAAFLANLSRTVFLTWLAASAGLESSERWHDRAGDVELAVGLLAVVALAWRAHRPRRAHAHPVAPPGPIDADIPPAAGARLRQAAWVALAVVVLAESGTQAWYRFHERAAGVALVHWRLRPADDRWQPVAVPAREMKVLQSTEASGRVWRTPDARFPTWVFLVSWEGDAARTENPEWHDPAICLPAAGARLVQELPPAEVDIGGRALPFSGYRFVAAGRPVTVFFCHWDAETARARAELPGAADNIRSRRWQRVRDGRREGDVAHIAFIVGTDDAEAALAWVRQWAPEILFPEAG
jgi:exosortase